MQYTLFNHFLSGWTFSRIDESWGWSFATFHLSDLLLMTQICPHYIFGICSIWRIKRADTFVDQTNPSKAGKEYLRRIWGRNVDAEISAIVSLLRRLRPSKWSFNRHKTTVAKSHAFSHLIGIIKSNFFLETISWNHHHRYHRQDQPHHLQHCVQLSNVQLFIVGQSVLWRLSLLRHLLERAIGQVCQVCLPLTQCICPN